MSDDALAITAGNFSGGSRRVFIIGAALAGLAVALGAFGAHGLQDYTDARGLANWETGVRYQVMHSLALLVLALGWNRYSPRSFKLIAWSFILGILIFSGSLYVLVLSGLRWLGAITPIGGVLMIIGWAMAAAAHRRST